MTDSTTQRLLNLIAKLILGLIVFVIVAPILFGWWLRQQYPSISTISISNMQAIGATALCPGQPLTVSYDFHASGSGVLIRDWTAFDKEPPKTIIFSTWRRFILEGPIDQHITETWHLPDSYFNYEIEASEPIPPGDYRRLIAISSPSDSTIIAIDGVDFSVRADCPQGD